MQRLGGRNKLGILKIAYTRQGSGLLSSYGGKNNYKKCNYSSSISEGFGKWFERKGCESVNDLQQFDGNEEYDSLCLILLSNPKYEQSLQFQQFLFDHVRKFKQEHDNKNKKNQKHPKFRQYLIATEHSESCFTIGKLRFDETFSKNHILHNPRQLSIHKIGRGGGITFHCPGQLVLYPLFDLENSSFLQKNIKWFSDEFMLRSLSVPFLQQFSDDLKDSNSKVGNNSNRILLNVGGESEMGIYASQQIINSDLETSEEKKRKLASLGLQLSRFVSMHGVAMNLNLSAEDLQSFRNDIVACGLHHVKMTSLADELKLDGISTEQYVHMMDILVSQLEKCHLRVDQIVHTDCENSKSNFVNFSEQEPSSELLNFINYELFQKN